MRHLNLFSLLMFIFSAGCHTMDQGPIETVRRYHQEGKFNGSILIAENNHILVDTAIGYRDFRNKAVFTKGTPSYIASLSKPFTAVAISILVEKGKLSFKDRASRFVPDLPSYADSITVMQLLNHTSGIKDYETRISRKGLKNSDVLYWLNDQGGLDFNAGAKFQYSNSGYIILALVIENISRMSYAQFLKQNIFGPLHMDRTTVYESETAIPDKAIGFNSNKHLNDYPLLTTGDGGLYSTAEDLFKFDRALRANRLLSRKSTALLYETPILQDGNKSEYAMGWFVEISDGFRTARHTGGLAGFRTLFWRELNNGRTIIALTNQGNAFPIADFVNDLKNALKWEH